MDTVAKAFEIKNGVLKGDIILKYNSDEAKNLKSYGELSDAIKINENALDDDDSDSESNISFNEEAEIVDINNI